MKNAFFILPLWLCLTMPAWAASAPLSPGTCERLNPRYVSGQDVHGKAVVPADLSDPVLPLPPVFKMELTIDAARAAGIPLPPGVEAQGSLGTLTLEDGRLALNGKPLESGPAEKLSQTLCAPETPSK